MPSKTLRGGANKTHARVSSTSSAGKLSLTGRTKSAEKIRRVDLTNHVVRTPVHRAEVTNGVGGRGRGSGGGGGGGDEDEWVSSESGAVTPAEEDDEVPPPTHDPAVPSTTPRARPPPLPRVNTSSINAAATTGAELPASPDSLNPGDTPTSPARRPPSVRNARPQPHPLIRARSYAAAPPVLTDDHSTAHRPGLRRQSSRASSLASVATMPLSLPFPTPSTTTATTPTTATATPPSVLSSPVHRARTLSAALSSLTAAAAALPHTQPPWRGSSPPLTVAFPPPRGGGGGGGGGSMAPHAMIPSPLAPPHAAATAHQNPFLEALQRVADAKARAGR